MNIQHIQALVVASRTLSKSEFALAGAKYIVDARLKDRYPC